jgi:hypothetical protein
VSRVSHGKPRPSLPRRGELRIVRPAREPADGERDASGRFVHGNRASEGKGWRTAATRLLGGQLADATMRRVSEDMKRLHGAVLRELPARESVLVRSMAAQWAQVSAVCSYFGAVALDAGLSTDAGIAAAERARVFGQRSERIAVTLLDVSSKLADATRRPGASANLQAAVERLEAMRATAPTEAGDEEASP